MTHPQEAEGCSLEVAIILLSNRGLAAMSIELDYKQVVNNISNNIDTNSKLGTILNYCKASLSFLPFFKISLLDDKQTI